MHTRIVDATKTEVEDVIVVAYTQELIIFAEHNDKMLFTLNSADLEF
jgi:hypothetical protein